MKSVAEASVSRSRGLGRGGIRRGFAEPSLEPDADWAIAEFAANATAISTAEVRMSDRPAEGALRCETSPVCGTPGARVLVRSLSGRAGEKIEQHPDQAVQNQHLHAAEPVGLAILRDLADDEHTAEDRRHLGSGEENVDRVAEKRRGDNQNRNDKEGNLSGGAYADPEGEIHLVRLRHFDRAEQRRHIADQGDYDDTDKEIGPAEGLFHDIDRVRDEVRQKSHQQA